MKELDPIQQDKTKVSVMETRKMAQKVHLETMRVIQPGHSMWIVDIATLYAEKVDITPDTVSFDGTPLPNEQQYDQMKWYTPALNERSAIWHFARSLGIKKKDFERWLKVKRDVLKKRNDQQLRSDQAVQVGE